MNERDELRIQDFLQSVKDAMLRLEDLGMEQFARRIEGLSANVGSFTKHMVRSGLVGITSSGKSSLLNVLLGSGKKILKEQSKATTNMIVFCSKSPEPELEINFDDGKQVKKRGHEVLDESIWKYTSEDENPQNKFNVKYIRLTLPSFLLDDGTEIADTPGLDAFGHKEHEDLTLREFLPQADMIIYLSAITSPMKDADRRILNKIMDADQRIMFVQTCKAAVVERSLGEGKKESVADLLSKYKGDLEKALAPFTKLKDAPIVQVETSLAMKYIKDKDFSAWQDSGMEEFVFVVKSLVKQLQGEYALKNLKKTVDETNALNNLIKNTIGEDVNKESNLEQQNKELASLKDFLQRMIRDKDSLVAKWKEHLNPIELYNYYNLELSRIYGYRYNFNPLHDKEFLTKVSEIREKTQNVKNDFLNAIDAAKERYGESFKELGLDIRRADMQATSMSSFFLPNVQKKRVSEATGTEQSTSKFFFGKEKKGAEAEFVDKDKFIRDLKVSLSMFFEPLSNHLDWWSNTINYSYIEPLQKKITSFEDDIARTKRGVSVDEAQYNALVSISNELEDILSEVSYLYNVDPSQRKTVRFNKYRSKVFSETGGQDSRNIFLQLGSRLFESLFHTYYLSCLGGIADKKARTVALIGQDYETQIDFTRRLLRFSGEQVSMLHKMERPYSINISDSGGTLRNVEIEGEFAGLLSFYILGNDTPSMDFVKSENVLDSADVIQVMIEDMHRVGSALTDLVDRNLFFDLLLKNKGKLLLTNPSASYFQKDRLHIMVTEAIAEIDKIFQPGPVRWFIYENFEIRYNYFNLLSNRMITEGIQPEDCLKEWKTIGIPLDEPFSESTLLEQFEEFMQNA
ncbi:MAG: dynamin family protein [Nitrospirae bacterium]|nr:dynamin family protein [Nitrospirota bacterium]